jgi:hypothetical protein
MKVGDKVITEIGDGVIARKDELGTWLRTRWMVHIPEPTKEFHPSLYPTNHYGFFESELTLIGGAE